MPKFRDIGFVFKKEENGEYDFLFKIFSKDFGKVEVLGKGIRKINSKLKYQINLFSLVEFEFVQGRFFKRLTGVIAIERFKNLKQNIRALSLSYYIGEILDKLIIREEKDIMIFNLILNEFKILNDVNLPFRVHYLSYYYFFWNLASLLGYSPNLYSCCVCDKMVRSQKIYFNVKEGGLMCFHCFQNTMSGFLVSQNLIKILRIINSKDFHILQRLKIGKKEIGELKYISNLYLSFLLNYETELI